MNTPNLNRLLAQATQRLTSNTVESVLAHDDVCELFGSHAEEIVEVLKAIHNDSMASDFNEHWNSYLAVEKLLKMLDQEATCQK